MKKILLFFGICLILIVRVSGQRDSVFASPKQLTYDKEYIANTCNTCLVEKFYPIGWSKDAGFAYLVEPPDEGCGCYLAEIYIVDLNRDHILWHYFYAGDKGFMESAVGAKVLHHTIYKNKDQLWKGEYTTIKTKLVENGIIQQSGFKTTSFPLINGKDTLNISFKPTYVSKETSKYGYKYIDSLQLVSTKNTLISTISTKKFMILPPVKVNIAGYLKSPFEERLVIMLSCRSKGVDGPPDLITCKTAGLLLPKN